MSRDVLKRHLSMHPRYAPQSDLASDSERHLLPRARQACRECARSKLRCNGGNPCERCRKRRCSCVYNQRTCEKSTSEQAIGSGRATSNPVAEERSMDPNLGFVVMDEMPIQPGSSDWATENPTSSWPLDDHPTPSAFDMGGLLFNPSLSLLDWDTIATSFDVYDLDSLQTGKEPRESGAGNVEDAQATLNSTQRHNSMASTSETTMEQTDQNVSCSDSTPSSADSWFMKWTPGTNENLVSFPDMSNVQPEILEYEDFGHVDAFDQRTYDDLNVYLGRCTLGQTFRAFQHSVLPPIEVMNCFVQLYFEKFHPSFPLLHKPSFNTSTKPSILALAVAATGCRHSKAPSAENCAIALQELLRRAIKTTVSSLYMP
jgi:hypothetical protein